MNARTTKTSATRCALQATALFACGGASGYLFGSLAPGDAHSAGFVAGGLVAFATLASFAALTPHRPKSPAPEVAKEEAHTSDQPQPPTPVLRLQPDDIFIPIEGTIIDEAALEALRSLGGEAFVNEVVSQFISEGVLTLLKVAQAVGEANAAEYAAQVHALRSSAANVGARRLYKLCLEWRELNADELAASGSARFVLLQKEFSAAEAILKGRKQPADCDVARLAKAS